MNEDPTEKNQIAAMLLTLRARSDSIVETIGQEVIASRGNQEWQRIYAALEESYHKQLEQTLLAIGDKNPGLAEALQKILEDAQKASDTP